MQILNVKCWKNISMKRIKVVIAGSYGAGKTRFINTASEIETVSTEVDLKDQSGPKKTTTVSMDYGRITLEDKTQLNLFGTPGQDYLDFMWDILSKGMQGFVFVVDSSDRDSLKNAGDILSSFDTSLPHVIAANKQDHPNTITTEEIRSHLNLSESIPIVPCAAVEKESVMDVLEALTSSIDLKAVPTLI